MHPASCGWTSSRAAVSSRAPNTRAAHHSHVTHALRQGWHSPGVTPGLRPGSRFFPAAAAAAAAHLPQAAGHLCMPPHTASQGTAVIKACKASTENKLSAGRCREERDQGKLLQHEQQARAAQTQGAPSGPGTLQALSITAPPGRVASEALCTPPTWPAARLRDHGSSLLASH